MHTSRCRGENSGLVAVFAMRINEVTSHVGGLYDVGGVTCAGRFARSTGSGRRRPRADGDRCHRVSKLGQEGR
jgi:hypothetical protein